jgi:hypothetical protein
LKGGLGSLSKLPKKLGKDFDISASAEMAAINTNHNEQGRKTNKCNGASQRELVEGLQSIDGSGRKAQIGN